MAMLHVVFSNAMVYNTAWTFRTAEFSLFGATGPGWGFCSGTTNTFTYVDHLIWVLQLCVRFQLGFDTRWTRPSTRAWGTEPLFVTYPLHHSCVLSSVGRGTIMVVALLLLDARCRRLTPFGSSSSLIRRLHRHHPIGLFFKGWPVKPIEIHF